MAGDEGRYDVDVEVPSGEAEVYVLRDRQSRSEARVIPALGNNLISFRVTPSGQAEPVEVMLCPPSQEELARGPVFYGNPILFPFPNRVRQGIYAFEGKTHQLRKLMPNGHAIHGLAIDQAWKVVETGASDRARLVSALRWEDCPSIHAEYPFPFVLTVTYTLSGARLRMESKAQNTGPGRMPMGFGIHPYLRLPLAGDGRREDCLVRVPASRLWELDPDLLPTGRTVGVPADLDFRQPRKLGSLALDNVYTGVRAQYGWSECLLRDPAAGLQLAVRADASFREIVVYAPLARPAICFEPYTCTTDALNLQPKGVDAGLIVLEPGAEWQGTIDIELRPA